MEGSQEFLFKDHDRKSVAVCKYSDPKTGEM